MAELRLGDCVGTGATAEVYRASWHGTDVAVKQLRCSGSLSERFQRELAVLVELRHPNLVLFMGASTLERPVIVSEFCEGGTVFQLLHQRREMCLSWKQRLKVALDTAKGMNFLHRRRVVHRDLKSLNLLLAAKVGGPGDVPWTKISDFGLSRHLPSGLVGPGDVPTCAMTGGLGTCLWMAPEVLSGGSYDEKVDIYSYGMVLFELICQRVPFEGEGLEPISVALYVSRGGRPELQHVPRACPEGFRAAMEDCWAQNPAKRPPFDMLLEFLKSVPCA